MGHVRLWRSLFACIKDIFALNHSNKKFKQIGQRQIQHFAIFIVLMVSANSASVRAQSGDDILDFMPSLLAAAQQARACDDGVFATCKSSVGCRKIDGIFENGQCLAKPLGQKLAEQFVGTWRGRTTFSNGVFTNLIEFDRNSLAKIDRSTDYSLMGSSFSSGEKSSPIVMPTIVSHDSKNDDWFIIDYWGTDIGLVSAIEINRTSENQFDGCEFLLNFPDLSYHDGECNPIRLRRVGNPPSTIRLVSNFVSDIGSYVANLFGSSQTGSRRAGIDENRPTIDRLVGVPRSAIVSPSPLSITAPGTDSILGGVSVNVEGTISANDNFKSLTINDGPVRSSGNTFSSTIPVDDGFNRVNISADFVRRQFETSVSFEIDNEAPIVVNVASASSSAVIVQFSEAMADDLISSITNFNIVRNDNQANLPVTMLSFVDDSNSAVLLETGLQSNVTYTLRVVNARDVAGNVISGPQEEVEQSLSGGEFVGTRPTGDELLDTDGDGILDHVELTGYTVIVRRTDGSFENILVTSDPFNDDPDEDGVSDAEERHAGTDPLNPDTDGDTLSDGDEWNRIYSNPADQDTDRDGIQDGFEFSFFKTSPILADTDGDQIDDPTELAAGNRNPLVADIPSPAISVGNINLQLDTRFTITNTEGAVRTEDQTTEATLTQSENDTFARSNENSTSNTLSNSQSLSRTTERTINAGIGSDGPEGGVSFGVSVTSARASEQSSSRGSTVAIGEESSQGTERAFNDSLSVGSEVSTDESVVRDVLDGALRVDLSIENASNIPFTISNLELTALAQDPNDRRQLIPIGSMTPQNGELGSINIGALGETARGPFVFSTRDNNVFPQEIEQLMKSPQGLVVQLANFDIVDEQGNNFAFTSQDVLDRTAGISFDFGDGRVETYRIATASDHNESTGQPSGISMRRALEIAGLIDRPVIRDGGNGRIETIVSGDDVVINPTQFVEPRAIIIEPGANGILDTVVLGGDDVFVQPDYETSLVVVDASIEDGGNGIIETTFSDDDDVVLVDQNLTNVTPNAVLVRAGSDQILQSTINVGGDDVLVPAGKPTRLLTRFRDREADSATTRFWTLFSSVDVEGIDLNDVIVRSGQQYNFTYVQDQDGDGVWAREEYLHNSSDTNVNTDGCADPTATTDECETLSDQFEIQQGWRVQLKNSPQGFRVYSSPSEADSDQDGLFDDVEFACGLDPRQQDTDLDGLTDFEELLGRRQRENGSFGTLSYVPSGLGETDPVDPSPIAILPYTGVITETLPAGSTRSALPLVEHISSADCDAILSLRFDGITGFALDPLNPDTDGDTITDLDEIRLGLNPNLTIDGAGAIDSDDDGLSDREEVLGYNIVVNGLTRRVSSAPDDADTDGDGLPDLLELFLRSDANDIDSDGDGVVDADEYRSDGRTLVNIGSGGSSQVELRNVPTPDFNFSAFEERCSAALACDIRAIDNGLRTRLGLGTNLTRSDTDGDSLSDDFELRGSYSYNLEGTTVNVTSIENDANNRLNPLRVDTDADGVNDNTEIGGLFISNVQNAITGAVPNVLTRTNPLEDDTDGDGLNDGIEFSQANTPFNTNDDRPSTLFFLNNARNPTVADKLARINTVGFNHTTNSGGAALEITLRTTLTRTGTNTTPTGIFGQSKTGVFGQTTGFPGGQQNVDNVVSGTFNNNAVFAGVIRGDNAYTLQTTATYIGFAVDPTNPFGPLIPTSFPCGGIISNTVNFNTAVNNPLPSTSGSINCNNQTTIRGGYSLSLDPDLNVSSF